MSKYTLPPKATDAQVHAMLDGMEASDPALYASLERVIACIAQAWIAAGCPAASAEGLARASADTPPEIVAMVEFDARQSSSGTTGAPSA